MDPLSNDVLDITIDINKRLPPELTIESVDDILYRIGLCLTSVREQPKRHWIFSPFLIFIFVSMFLIKELMILSTNEENGQFLKALVALGQFYGTKWHFHSPVALFSILCLSSQTHLLL